MTTPLMKPEKLGLVVCKHKENHTDCEADMFVIYMFLNHDMYEQPPTEFWMSVLKDRVVLVSYGECASCRNLRSKPS